MPFFCHPVVPPYLYVLTIDVPSPTSIRASSKFSVSSAVSNPMAVSASSSLRLLCCDSCEKRLVCEPQVSSTVLLSGLTDTLLIAFAATFAAHLSFTSGFSYLIVLHLYTSHFGLALISTTKKEIYSFQAGHTYYTICHVSLESSLVGF